MATAPRSRLSARSPPRLPPSAARMCSSSATRCSTRFIVGRVTRISPEAPVPVVAFDHETHRIGGAANVAHNIAALGGHATLIAVTGQDDNCEDADAGLPRRRHRSRVHRHRLRARRPRPRCASSPSATSRSRASTTRTMRRLPATSNTAIVAAIQQHGGDASAIVVSDYLKGCVTEARHGGRRRRGDSSEGIPLLVDPKIPHIDYYAGATVDHAEPSRGGDRDALADPIGRRTRAMAAQRVPRSRAMRMRPDDARRSGHVAARPETPRASCRRRRARSPTSPARATP